MSSSVLTPPSERTARTLSSTSSHTSRRRSSLSSVTSSGRRRKDQSLLDVAVALGQRTPERSRTSDESVPPRSRQLDFGGDDADDVSEETQLIPDEPVQQETAEGDGEEAAGGDREQPEAGEAADVASGRPRRGRRETVFWSADEEEFLRQGVAKYGIGKWKKILMDGQGVFSRHRTNVDLKDKWKNLQAPRHTSRKRRRAPGTMTPPPENATANEERSSAQVVPVRTAKKRRAISDETSDVSSPESTGTRPRRKAAVVAERAVALIAAAGETEMQRGAVEFKFATKKSFPEFIAVTVDVDTCRDVSTLKDCLRSSVLSHAPADAYVEFVGIKSRTLYEDNESLWRCIQENGLEFFLVVHEDSPEEFV